MTHPVNLDSIGGPSTKDEPKPSTESRVVAVSPQTPAAAKRWVPRRPWRLLLSEFRWELPTIGAQDHVGYVGTGPGI